MGRRGRTKNEREKDKIITGYAYASSGRAFCYYSAVYLDKLVKISCCSVDLKPRGFLNEILCAFLCFSRHVITTFCVITQCAMINTLKPGC